MTGSAAPRAWYAQARARWWSCAPAAQQVIAFHAALPGYAPTPLVEVPALASALHVRRVFVKDESSRLGLAAFKVLGASWAVFRVLAERAGRTTGAVPASLDDLRTVLRASPPIELRSATDGNHGRAVARMARLLGVAAHIYVPAVIDAGVVADICGEGAVVTTVGGTYDEAVRTAARDCGHLPGVVLVQDTAWPGYERVPAWIVEGYATLFRELDVQLGDAGEGAAGLIAVPVGVGSLAQAAVVHVRSRVTVPSTAVLGVEPETAACVLASLHAGRPRPVDTATTVMAGLNCGTPSSIAWPYLRAGLDAAVAISDAEAALAVQRLQASGIAAGPSGAASLAGAIAALTGPGSAERRAALGVGSDTVIVLLSTEGSGTSRVTGSTGAAPTT